MKSLTDEAIVAGLMDYREADSIVHLFSREHGRLSGVARGAKKSVTRFGGAFELFARISVNFHPGENLAQIRSAEPLTIYPGIRRGLDSIAHASYAVELVAAMTPERLPLKRVFRLLTAYLEQLDRFPADPSDRHFFEINLLNILGYRPVLESCATCGATIAPAGGCCSSGTGQDILCRSCGQGGLSLDGASLALLAAAMKTGRFGEVRFSPAGIAAVDRFLQNCIGAIISRPLKSLPFLRLSP